MRARPRSASLVEDYDYILPFDEALVWPEDEDEALRLWERYEETLDAGLLAVRDGYTPTVWTLQHLTGMSRRHLIDIVKERSSDGHLTAAALRTAAAMALVRVRGLDLADGSPLKIRRIHDSTLGVDVVRPEILDTIEDLTIETCEGDEIPGDRIVDQLGAAAVRRAYVGNGSPRG